MQDKIISTINSTFAEDVYKGLTDFPKHLSSKYFYDERGDRLFQDIMQMPEYYLTNREFDILSQHKREIVEWFAQETDSINLCWRAATREERNLERQESNDLSPYGRRT